MVKLIMFWWRHCCLPLLQTSREDAFVIHERQFHGPRRRQRSYSHLAPHSQVFTYVVTLESNIKLVRFINTLLLNTLSYFLSLKVSNCYSQDDVEDFHSCYASQGKVRFIWSSKILYLKSSIFQLDHSQIDKRFCLNVKCVSKELQELVRRSFLSPMNLFLFSTFWLSPLNRLHLEVF